MADGSWTSIRVIPPFVCVCAVVAACMSVFVCAALVLCVSSFSSPPSCACVLLLCASMCMLVCGVGKSDMWVRRGTSTCKHTRMNAYGACWDDVYVHVHVSGWLHVVCVRVRCCTCVRTACVVEWCGVAAALDAVCEEDTATTRQTQTETERED